LPRRPTPAAQRTVGATYIAAAARAFVARDAAVLPLLDGSGVRPASVGRARVLVSALGGRRRAVVVAGTDRLPAPSVGREGTVSASLCQGFSSSSRVVTCPSFLGAQGVHPHFLPLGLPGEPGTTLLTVAGDGPESHAMHAINPRAMVSATKSTLGHSLGATGAVEAAICALALKYRTVPPMRNLETIAQECAELYYVTGEPRRAPDLEVALCANLGVGGHNAAVVLEKI